MLQPIRSFTFYVLLRGHPNEQRTVCCSSFVGDINLRPIWALNADEREKAHKSKIKFKKIEE